METHSIATIVNFCTNERRFLTPLVEQALLFSKQILIVVADHFFDSTLENHSLLSEIYAAFPECLFLQYPYLPSKIPKKTWKKIDPAHFWHSVSRLIGVEFLKEEIETVLFLDADEVPDGRRFVQWLACSDYRHHMALKLSNYWYFREPINQSLSLEDTIVLAQKRGLEREILLHSQERDAIYNLLPGPKRRQVASPDGEPMFHHYSWVRTKEEMLKKVYCWGHREERNWASLIEEEFSAPFRGTDFIHGYRYRTVSPFYPLSWEEPLFLPKGKPNLKKLSEEELISILKMRNFWRFFGF